MKKALINLIKFYKRYLSFDTGLMKFFSIIPRTCRFTPSCSEYTYEAIKKYGIIFGIWKGLGRIIKCHPFNQGGLDPLR